MAYVEVTKDGKVITRRELDEEKAVGGCPIRLGPLGEITLAIGQKGQLGDYDLTVFAGPMPPADAPVTARPAPPRPAPDQAPAPQSPSASEPPPPAPPAIDGYKILAPIGQPPAGLWKAVQLASQKIVALKVFPADTFADESVRARFVQEIKLAARLEHPNVARVLDSAVRRNAPSYCVMELVEGLSLDLHVLAKRLTVPQIAALMKTVCMALETAHQKGLLHRRLSLASIVVTPDGQPHVLDFALPRPGDPGSPLQGALASQAPAQPTFIAPEQAAGPPDKADARGDVYSLGAILYRLVTGKYPHDMSGLQFEVYRRIIDRDVVGPRQASKAVDEDMEALLLTALARDPGKRYASPLALAADLDNYIRCRPLNCRPRTRQYAARKFVARRKWPVGIAAAAVVILGIVAAVHFGGAGKRAEDERIRQADQKRQADDAARQKKFEDADIARLAREQAIYLQGESTNRPASQAAAGPATQPVAAAVQPAPVAPVAPAPPASPETAGLPTAVEWTSLFDGKSLGNWKVGQDMPVPGSGGQVRIDNDALMFQEGQPFTGLAWAGDFPTSYYEISVEAMRLSGAGTFCDLMVPVGSACASVHMGGRRGKGIGVRYTGPAGPDVAAAADKVFDDLKWYELRLRVARAQVLCFVNNEQVLEVAIADFLAKAPANLPHPGKLRVLTWGNTSAAFRNLRFRRLTVAEVAPPKPVTPTPATRPAPGPATQPVKPTPPLPGPAARPGPAIRPSPVKPAPVKPTPKPPATKPAPKPPTQPAKPPEPPKPDPINPPPTKPAGQAKDRLNEKFGAELKKAAGANWKEGVELAGKLLEAAKALDYDPDLMTLLCEDACTLGLKNPAGYGVADEAMEFLADEVPDKRLEALDKVVTIRQKAYGAARGLDKASALEELLSAQVASARARLAQRDLMGASRLLQQAQGLAASAHSPSLDDIKDLYKDVQAAEVAERLTKVAEARRKEKGDDEMVKRTLLVPTFLDQDNPAQAEKLLYDKADANLKKFVPLAAKPLADLSEEECLDLAGYYAELVDKASYYGRQTALRRMVLCYRSYLARHKGDDDARKKAQADLAKAEKDLARMGDPVTGLGEWQDLLPLVNLKADVTGGGKWAFNGSSLTSEAAAPNSMVALPQKLTGSYALRVRLVPLGDAVGAYLIDLPVADRAVTLIVAGKDGGLAKAKGAPKLAAKNLEVGKACQVTATVSIGPGGVEIVTHVNGLAYAKWSGHVGDLAPLAPDKKDPNGLPVVRVGLRAGTCRFLDVRAKLLSGQSLPLRPREAVKGLLD